MKDHLRVAQGYYSAQSGDVDALQALVSRSTEADTCPHATEIASKIPIYDIAGLGPIFDDPEGLQALMAEWADVLRAGAGIVVLRGAYADTTCLDEAAQVYRAIIAEEKQANGGGADHFAAAGANDRVWNALQKLCLRAPGLFLRCFSNRAIAAVSTAWLGPNYQMTAQINLVYPGGAAQESHRDYHLGFMTADEAAAYPAHVHHLSPFLTLQGAVAHCDMPVESGPTKLLPFSQLFGPGYAAFRRSDVRAVFDRFCVQLPLSKGDAMFFNPAVLHAAGENITGDVERLANLLQVSSAFGRAMENVDRVAMAKAVYPFALESDLTKSEIAAAVASCAEGYAFPSNLDTDPPVGGLAPESPQALMLRALEEGMSARAFGDALDNAMARRRAQA